MALATDEKCRSLLFKHLYLMASGRPRKWQQSGYHIKECMLYLWITNHPVRLASVQLYIVSSLSSTVLLSLQPAPRALKR